MKYSRSAKVEIFITCSFYSPWLVPKESRPWKLFYYKLNQAVVPIATALPGVMFLLEPVILVSGLQYSTAIDLANPFPHPHQSARITRSCLHSPGIESSILLSGLCKICYCNLVYLEVIF